MDIGKLMQQAGEMQTKMQELQEKIAEMEITGEAGAGMVKVVMNGKGYAKSVSVDPSLIADGQAEILEDLIAAAINDAKSKIDTQGQEKMQELTAGLPLPPGMKLPF